MPLSPIDPSSSPSSSLSNYSSADASEFDRYSSALSAFGSASVSSSPMFHNSHHNHRFANPPFLSISNHPHSDDADDSDDAGATMKMKIHRDESKERSDKWNPLLMNSVVAFGDGDWDEFELEAAEDQDCPELIWKQSNDAECSRRDRGDVLVDRHDAAGGSVDKENDVNVAECSEKVVSTLSSSVQDCEQVFIPEVTSENVIADDEIDAGVEIVEYEARTEISERDNSSPYDEMVLEMEEILLDSENSRPTLSANRAYIGHQSQHFRDGSSTASTSGTDDTYPPPQKSSKIDWVEVIGAKQKKGDVSFGERLVGVKEYTVYILRVWNSTDQWEIERRYRDFYALYRQLKDLFSFHRVSLPYPWSFVDKESRKYFGNASPSVVNERSALIQDCLRSVLKSNYTFGTPKPLVYFLSQGEVAYDASLLKALIPQSLHKLGETFSYSITSNPDTLGEAASGLGKTIFLIVDLKFHQSVQQLLELQHYKCAGCHKLMDVKKTLFRDLVQTLGLNKPRYCEYTGQLFCTLCHMNDTAVIPAKVLHLWDFSLYPVSQLAKAYLESIYDKPMLCVSAVNPLLFSKVPALLRVMDIRKKISGMFPYIQCPFRRSVLRGLGSRRHLLENNDFFALRDLVDLSKGAFAGLPVMAQNLSNRIFEHITQQCLECYDVGVPCAARQACDDPLSMIFPFQEADAAKCSSCGSIFHKSCFVKLIICPCGKAATGSKRNITPENESGTGFSQALIKPSSSSSSTSTSSFFSDILSKARPDKLLSRKDSNPVILMSTLPSNSLL